MSWREGPNLSPDEILQHAADALDDAIRTFRILVPQHPTACAHQGALSGLFPNRTFREITRDFLLPPSEARSRYDREIDPDGA